MRSARSSDNSAARHWQPISVGHYIPFAWWKKLILSDNRLGLVVAPGQVRLQPSAGDGYAWSVTESKKSLLQSNLGSGSVGLYRSICEELGRSLEAVTPQTLQVAQSERDHLAKEEVSIPIHQAASGACTALMIQDTAGPKRRNRKWFIYGKNPRIGMRQP
jgi:hypothetical protein